MKALVSQDECSFDTNHHIPLDDMQPRFVRHDVRLQPISQTSRDRGWVGRMSCTNMSCYAVESGSKERTPRSIVRGVNSVRMGYLHLSDVPSEFGDHDNIFNVNTYYVKYEFVNPYRYSQVK